MRTKLTQILDTVPSARKALIIPALALRTVLSSDGKSVYASSDTLFRGAIFGRDSLEVAEDLMLVKPNLVHNILIKMAELQGLTYSADNEEEPGKIIHEYRTLKINGKLIDRSSQNIFHELSKKWGGNNSELAYYGSVDSTPLFLKTLHKFCSINGDAILRHEVVRRDGSKVSMLKSSEDAANWLVGKIDSSGTGLLEFKRLNPHGMPNQAWKDSDQFYVHEDKQAANHDQPIASIEVQGLAYDALLGAASLFSQDSGRYESLAMQIRDRTLNMFWQDDRAYFALGSDYDKNGRIRMIRTQTANPAAMLDTGFFDQLPEQDREVYITAIVRKMFSKEFLTVAGIRSRSLSAAHLVNFWDYHGSFVSWPKETYDIAKGLRRQGLPKLARQLENRLLNIILRTHEYPEFVYVDEWGRLLSIRPTKREHGELVLVEGTNTPERTQAWTVSAIMAIIAERYGKKMTGRTAISQEPWQKNLEQQVLNAIPHVDRYINPLKLLMKYPTHRYRFAPKKDQSV